MATQLNNEGMDTGSNYKFADKMIRPNFPRSLFDDSHLVTRDISEAGLVFPISLMETLPASEYEISMQWLIRVMPQVVPLMSKQRVYFYAFYSRCADLWSSFDVFIRKGYSGNEVKTVPVLNRNNCFIDTDTTSKTNPQWSAVSSGVLAHSLGDFFGLPIGSFTEGLGSVHSSINAMPFMMYARIWRDYFLNRNYYVNDRCILPDDDSRFRLLDNGSVGSFSDESKKLCFDFQGRFSSGVTTSTPYSRVSSKGMSYQDNVFIVAPFYHDYPADYFTSSLPWPQRGNTPELPISGNFSLDTPSLSDMANLTFPTFISGTLTHKALQTFEQGSIPPQSTDFGIPYLTNYASTSASTASEQVNNAFNNWFGRNIALSSVSSGTSLSITLEQLRELSVAQTILEKMARTDGSYREFGLTFFGEASKSATDYRPTFVGGCTGQLVFTEVLQTSSSTDTSVLGQQAGHGISMSNSGYLGRFHSDDYGYLMILGCIMPDVYYSQGLKKMWTRLNQSDWFLPERALLGMQPIYNRELYFQNDSVLDDDDHSINGGLWAYQDIFDEYRYQDNIIGGQVADSSKLSFYPFTQSRKFTSLPNWGQEFGSSDDIRTDYLAASIESAYVGQFDINIRAVKPLPYVARPAGLLNGVN